MFYLVPVLLFICLRFLYTKTKKNYERIVMKFYVVVLGQKSIEMSSSEGQNPITFSPVYPPH